MSWASELTTCPQCAFPEAADELNCSTYSGYVFCPRCGYTSRNECGETVQEIPGYGVMCRGRNGARATFATAFAVADEELALFQNDPDLVYLTRWNGEKVELLVGEYPLTEAEIEAEAV